MGKDPFEISEDALETVEINIPLWRVVQGIASTMRKMADGEDAVDLERLRRLADELAGISSIIADHGWEA